MPTRDYDSCPYCGSLNYSLKEQYGKYRDQLQLHFSCHDCGTAWEDYEDI